jgi:CSLREA domain-containing protein
MFCYQFFSGAHRAALVVILTIVFSTFSLAATYTVTKVTDTNDGTCDADCSLREAVATANATSADDVIEFESSVFSTRRIIALSGTQLVLANNGSLTINGTGADRLLISGDNLSRAFIVNYQAVIAINRLSITNGNAGASSDGGALHNSGLTTMTGVIVRNNHAGNVGGGLANVNPGSLVVIDSAVFDNLVDGSYPMGSCGGIFNNFSVTIRNSTITRNTASQYGGGICNSDAASSLSLTNVTIAFNVSTFGGGGVVNGEGVTIARNTIIANNTDWYSPDFGGRLTSQGYNLIENTLGATISGSSMGNIIGQDPGLRAMAWNGGPTPTLALLPGSVAIDAGDPMSVLATDQRGVTRPRDGDGNGTVAADIGAFERDPAQDNPSFDFDGDGKTDIAIFRPSVAEWWVNRSSNGSTFAATFGAPTDSLVPTDYTGDGKADIAAWRPETGEWFVLRSEDYSYFSFPFGANGDVPTPADYDADGKTDATVFRPSNSTWYVRRSSDSGTTIQEFGATGDVPVASDYDGDGKTDFAIFRPSAGQWWMNRSTAGVLAVTFGNSSDKLVPGDFTGDGKSDNALWRPSTGEWFILRSDDFSFYSFPFGTTDDVPAPGDYDGDGKFDATVFRPSNATWYSQRTTAGTLIQQFGANGDRPVPNAFVP